MCSKIEFSVELSDSSAMIASLYGIMNDKLSFRPTFLARVNPILGVFDLEDYLTDSGNRRRSNVYWTRPSFIESFTVNSVRHDPRLARSGV